MSIRDRMTDPQLVRDINCGILDGLRLRSGLALGHVLLVESDANIRVLLSGTLRRAGYRVSTATNLAGSLQAARGDALDLILVDIVTEDDDGLSIVAALRSRATDVKIAAYCGNDRFAEHLEAAISFGADDIVDKPDDAASLLHIVRDLIELPDRRRRRERPRKRRAATG